MGSTQISTGAKQAVEQRRGERGRKGEEYKERKTENERESQKKKKRERTKFGMRNQRNPAIKY